MQDGLLPGTEGHKELAESKPEELEFQTTSLMVSYRKAAHISLYCITLENLYGHSVYNCCRAQQIQTRTEYRQRCMKDACCIKSHRLELRENIRWSSSFRSLSCDSSIDFFFKSSSPQSAIYCFLFKFQVSTCFLKVIQ